MMSKTSIKNDVPAVTNGYRVAWLTPKSTDGLSVTVRLARVPGLRFGRRSPRQFRSCGAEKCDGAVILDLGDSWRYVTGCPGSPLDKGDCLRPRERCAE